MNVAFSLESSFGCSWEPATRLLRKPLTARFVRKCSVHEQISTEDCEKGAESADRDFLRVRLRAFRSPT
jgi:hypothetical protein